MDFRALAQAEQVDILTVGFRAGCEFLRPRGNNVEVVDDARVFEIRIRHHACGLNFIDIYQRTGQYQNPLPLVLGMEGAGTIEAVGKDVQGVRVGSREWVWEGAHGKWDGTAAELVREPASRAKPLPEGLSIEDGAKGTASLVGRAETVLPSTATLRWPSRSVAGWSWKTSSSGSL